MLTKNIVIFLFLAFVMTSCNKEDSLPINKPIIEKFNSDVKTKSGSNSTVVIKESPYGPQNGEFIVISGASSNLHRTPIGINVNFKTENLIPNNAYTLWFVIFGDATGPPTVTYAAGHLVGGSGKGNFSAHKKVGEGFNNPLSAEVHMALRTHGPAQPGMIPDQIQTMAGVCTNGFPSGPTLYPDSDVVGYCANVQVAMHPSN